jgi:integrase
VGHPGSLRPEISAQISAFRPPKPQVTDLRGDHPRNFDKSQVKLPAARFHDLRHSFAVNLLSATPAVDFKRVSKWLGHSTFTLTLDVYGDYINEDISQPAGLSRPVAMPTNVVTLQRKAD